MQHLVRTLELKQGSFLKAFPLQQTVRWNWTYDRWNRNGSQGAIVYSMAG